MGFTTRVVAIAVVLAAAALPKPPAVDEESYLWLGRVLSWGEPYAWSRAWPGVEGQVYAHPPLFLWWMKLLSPLGLGARLPSLGWVALYALGAATWMKRTCQHPGYAAAAWLASPTVLLGVQDSLMIDLPTVALATCGVAAYREALSRPATAAWLALSGGLLGLAVETKYPAGLVALAVTLHAVRVRLAPAHALALLGTMGAVVGAVEGFVYLRHGVVHPLVAWEARGLVESGPLPGRWLGTLARLALLPTALGLLLAGPRHVVAGTLVAGATLLLVRPADLGGGQLAALLGFAALGGALLSRAVLALLSPSFRRRKGDRHDALLLGAVVVAVTAGVVGLHNYAAARYLLPAAVPGAILVARAAEEVASGKRALLVATVLSGVVAVATAVADWRFVTASIDVAERAASGTGARAFMGEWSFRHAMEAAGAERVFAPLPAGSRVVVDEHSGGRVPASWEPLQRFESTDRFPLRVVDIDADAGLYAETLGPLPLALGSGPVAAATLYEAR